MQLTGRLLESPGCTRPGDPGLSYVARFRTTQSLGHRKLARLRAGGPPASPAEQTAVAAGPQAWVDNCICLPPTGGAAGSGLVWRCASTISPRPLLIPLLADLAPRLGVRTCEFSPHAQETLRLVGLQITAKPAQILLLRFGKTMPLTRGPPG